MSDNNEILTTENNYSNIETDSPQETYEEIIEKKYWESKAKYYRHIIRKEDTLLLKNILKIPDDWERFNPNNDVKLSMFEKKRLSDIKKRKSQELKYESLNIFYLVNLETNLIKCLKYKHVPVEQLDESCDSIRILLNQNINNLNQFKHLLLSLAKRAASDLYYLIFAYQNFIFKNPLDFEKDFPKLCDKFINIFENHKLFEKNIPVFKTQKKNIDKFFPKSSSLRGWKIDEIALKNFIETNKKNIIVSINNFKTILKSALAFKNNLKQNFKFFQYYYNESDGKLFRYNFITHSFSKKLENKLISKEVYELFHDIRDNFVSIKDNLTSNGLPGYGPFDFTYITVLEFLYKLCKIIEFYLLRNSKYDELQIFRSEYSHNIEKEFDHLKPDSYNA